MQYWNDAKCRHGRPTSFSTDLEGMDEVNSKQRKEEKAIRNNSSQNSNMNQRERIVVNICGAKYEILESTIQRYPKTLLADHEKRLEYWDEERREYFFDRNRLCFESVLTYYQSGGLILRPPHIPDVLFIRELEFYELGDKVVNTVKSELILPEEKRDFPKNKLQAQIWSLFEYPDTGNIARLIALFSCTIVLLSIVLFCIETLPAFHDKDSKHDETFYYIEAICIAWFCLEYIIRFFSSPNKYQFFTQVLNIIDLVAILPFFISFGLNGHNNNVSSMALLRAVRLVRVFRIFKLSRYSTGLQILGMTLRASMGELGLLVFFLTVGVILFSSAVYYAEMDHKNSLFKSIPHSFWWAIVTMTTVGYGDMYPKTFGGKIVGCLCACTGILAIALPVPVIVSNFEYFYSKAQRREEGNTDEINQKFEKQNRLKNFLAVLNRRRPNNRSNEETCFDMGPFPMHTESPHNCNDSHALNPHNDDEEDKDQEKQEMKLWKYDGTLRASNV
ncbi:potassium voltage-gated channel subfamily A member 7-like [Xenia sp. Carnegie-2017]|uniref:potassium voltage-gated channel subfamily A member 7-like n=1 Tax=Xenia sp. Carnegie-2017 TaxID=2897299 RepID=UPI001F043704|nr:potassium voltage-gated channel subfamily A member 7-like [Xenia sp. Carnegie-2017]